VAESFPDVSLDSRVRHGVFLAFKEALNNAVRHSGASEVRITMEVVNDWLNITVSDNGKGFAGGFEDQPGHDGLAGIQRRMQEFGGTCEINSQPGEGTQIRFRLPLAERLT
jgi:signal transduction histidine kinase